MVPQLSFQGGSAWRSHHPALAADAASMARRIDPLRTRAFVEGRRSTPCPPATGRRAAGSCPRPQNPLSVHRAKRRTSRRVFTLVIVATITRSVAPRLGLTLHREAQLWRDPLRGVGAIGEGMHSAAAPAALHGLGLKPSPCLEAAFGLLLRPAMDRHLAHWRAPSDRPLAVLATKPTRPRGRRPWDR
jgi:hypothetical protein